MALVAILFCGCQYEENKKEPIEVSTEKSIEKTIEVPTEEPLEEGKEEVLTMEDLQAFYDKGQVNKGNGHRLQKVMDKARNGQPITLGFLGGSITQGCHSTVPEKSYPALVYQWFVDTFPESQVTYVNAGIGGTDSFYGVHRIDRDLLKHKPDLVFVEFSVNDMGLSHVEEYYEGILVRLLSQPQETAVMIINTMFYDSGQNMQSIHNKVAMTYDLPIVSVRDGLWEEISGDSIDPKELSDDLLHPNDLGHGYMAGMITTLLEKHQTDLVSRDMVEDVAPIPNDIPYLNGQLLTGKELEPLSISGWTLDPKKPEYLGDLFKGGWKIGETSGDIVFKISGSRIALQYKKYINDLGGRVSVYVDDQEIPIIVSSDFAGGWGHTLGAQKLVDDSESKEHLIRIHMDETLGRYFYITAFYVD